MEEREVEDFGSLILVSGGSLGWGRADSKAWCWARDRESGDYGRVWGLGVGYGGR